MTKIKGAAQVVEPASISPAWKVLKMKMREEKSEMAGGKVVKRKPKGNLAANFHRKQKLQDALNEESLEPKVLKKTKNDNLVALDCEYVGGGYQGNDDVLARVSIVNSEGDVVYDSYVKPTDKVTDYRTSVSGVRPGNLVNGKPFQTVQFEVSKLLKDKTVVGHAIHNDFRVLNIAHSKKNIRDTARCNLLKSLSNFEGRMPSLKKLAESVLGIEIQKGEHDSVTDARVTLRLYEVVKKKWEAEIKRYRH
ncbi:unnamed protein product [Auanema sp. JU1783]|nr:unnamed protein product [Auanema sp. JU1783]